MLSDCKHCHSISTLRRIDIAGLNKSFTTMTGGLWTTALLALFHHRTPSSSPTLKTLTAYIGFKTLAITESRSQIAVAVRSIANYEVKCIISLLQASILAQRMKNWCTVCELACVQGSCVEVSASEGPCAV